MAMTNKEKAEALKNQHFGVEIEMYGITREKAAELTARLLGGRHEDTHMDDGYCTWSAFAPDGRKWKFSRDSSIDAATDDERCEMVTPILGYSDIPTLVSIVDMLKENGAQSDPKHVCGIHIHVDGVNHTAKTIKNLVNLMVAHEEQLAAGINLDLVRQSDYCQFVDKHFAKSINDGKHKTMESIEADWYCGYAQARTRHYHKSRYKMLNLHSFFNGHGTVEFRFFQFQDGTGIITSQLKSMIQMALALNSLALVSSRCSRKKATKANNSTSFKDWLSRIGFVGDEFKEARKFWSRKTERGLDMVRIGVLEAA